MSGPTATADRPSDRPRRPSSRRDRLDQLRRLTARDRLLLSWLAEHYVLTTIQITQALFASQRSARLRLATLHTIGGIGTAERTLMAFPARAGHSHFSYATRRDAPAPHAWLIRG